MPEATSAAWNKFNGAYGIKERIWLTSRCSEINRHHLDLKPS